MYYTTDANMNVTAVIDRSTGLAVERYSYDPYGKPAIHKPDWSGQAAWESSRWNEVLYCGYRYDWETGNYHVRRRVYHPALGRFTSRDPAGYVDGPSLYQYVGSRPVCAMDPMGLYRLEWDCQTGLVSYLPSWYDMSGDSPGGFVFARWTSECGGGYVVRTRELGHPYDLVFSREAIAATVSPTTRDFGGRDGREKLMRWLLAARPEDVRGFVGYRDSKPEFHAGKPPRFTTKPGVELGAAEAETVARQEALAGSVAYTGVLGYRVWEVGMTVAGSAAAAAAIRPPMSGTAYSTGRGTVQVSAPARAPAGEWTTATESMSGRAAMYQAQVTGRSGQAYVVNGVRFDGLRGNVLVDAKGPGYASFVKNGQFQPWFTGDRAIIQQATNQIRAANGAAIQWHIAEQQALPAFQRLLAGEEFKAIQLIHTPVVP